MTYMEITTTESLKTVGSVFVALDSLKTNVVDAINEGYLDEDTIEALETLLEEIDEEIRYFNDEDYYGSLRTYERLRDEVAETLGEY